MFRISDRYEIVDASLISFFFGRTVVVEYKVLCIVNTVEKQSIDHGVRCLKL